MKHAYLIIAHQEFAVLEALIEALDYPCNDIFLHLDRKVEYRVKYKPQYSNLILVSDAARIDVRWGDCTQIWSELALYKTATAHGKYDYYHLLSGIDFPIKSQEYIHRFFERQNGKIFQGIMPNAWRTRTKLQYFHFFTKNLKSKTLRGHVETNLHWFLTQIQKVLCIKRNMDCFPELCKGANWSSLPHEAVMLILSKEKWIRKRFNYTYACDEVYKAIILWNSPLREKIYNTEDEYEGCMRLVDWKRGNPYIWQESDLEEIFASNKLFARKFCSANIGLIEKIRNQTK